MHSNHPYHLKMCQIWLKRPTGLEIPAMAFYFREGCVYAIYLRYMTIVENSFCN